MADTPRSAVADALHLLRQEAMNRHFAAIGALARGDGTRALCEYHQGMGWYRAARVLAMQVGIPFENIDTFEKASVAAPAVPQGGQTDGAS